MIAVCKSTFSSKFALTIQFPIPTHFCLELLLEITLRRYHRPRLNCLNIKSVSQFVIHLTAIQLITNLCQFSRIMHRVEAPGTILVTYQAGSDILPVRQVTLIDIILIIIIFILQGLWRILVEIRHELRDGVVTIAAEVLVPVIGSTLHIKIAFMI